MKVSTGFHNNLQNYQTLPERCLESRASHPKDAQLYSSVDFVAYYHTIKSLFPTPNHSFISACMLQLNFMVWIKWQTFCNNYNVLTQMVLERNNCHFHHVFRQFVEKLKNESVPLFPGSLSSINSDRTDKKSQKQSHWLTMLRLCHMSAVKCPRDYIKHQKWDADVKESENVTHPSDVSGSVEKYGVNLRPACFKTASSAEPWESSSNRINVKSLFFVSSQTHYACIFLVLMAFYLI